MVVVTPSAVHTSAVAPVSHKLNPSELGFLWQECQRCFYLSKLNGVKRPSTPFPSIFGKIDKSMRDYFHGKRTHEIDEALPPGSLDCQEQFIRSAPIVVPGHTATCYFSGKYDSLAGFDDGAYVIIDFKTANTRENHVATYARQLHAYAWTLERPAAGGQRRAPVSRLGLLCVEPRQLLMMQGNERHYLYRGAAQWIECPRDDGAFLAFLGEVLDVLSLPQPPAAARDCAFCEYRALARRMVV